MEPQRKGGRKRRPPTVILSPFSFPTFHLNLLTLSEREKRGRGGRKWGERRKGGRKTSSASFFILRLPLASRRGRERKSIKNRMTPRTPTSLCCRCNSPPHNRKARGVRGPGKKKRERKRKRGTLKQHSPPTITPLLFLSSCRRSALERGDGRR